MRKSLILSLASVSWLVSWSMLSELVLQTGSLAAKDLNSNASAKKIVQALPTTPINRPILRIGSQGQAVSELQATLKLLGFYNDAVDGVYRDSTAIAVSQFQQSAGLTPDGIAGPATWNRLFPDTSSSASRSVTAPSATKPPTRTPSSTSSRNSASSFPVPSLLQSTSANPNVTVPPPEQPVQRTLSNRPASRRASTPANTSQGEQPTSVAVTLPILRRGMQGPAVVQLQERLKTLGFLQGSVDGFFGEATQSAVIAAQEKFNLQSDGIVGPATWRALLR
jgi:peptidoglycan hydrolase-like protein with peptidoglycan-binding domain